MKTPIGILLLLGLSAAALFGQAQPDAPGADLGLASPTAPPAGPLTPAVSLDDVPAAPGSPAPVEEGPIVISDAMKEALAGKTEEVQQRFARLLGQAGQLIQENQTQGALELILEAEAIEADFFALHNLKGAAFSKIRDFDKATASFKRCLELNPGSMEARFNLAEMDFVQKRYASAFEAFTAILRDNPKMPAQTRSLLHYKNYLCLLVLDKADEADAVFKTFRFDSDTPEYYFANAAKSFHAGEKDEARGWLGSAGRIYHQSLVALYLDSLVELGWIETL